jgi:hypothetical protein
MMKELKKLLAEREIAFHSDDNRIMCFPHVVNIATQHILRALTNPPDDDDKFYDDGADQGGAHAGGTGEDNNEVNKANNDDADTSNDSDNSTDEEDNDQGRRGNNIMRRGASNYQDAIQEDPINLCRKVARTVRSSGQRRDEFDEMVTNGNTKEWFRVDGQVVQVSQLQLLLDVKTRWDSTFIMMKRFIELQPVCIISAAL